MSPMQIARIATATLGLIMRILLTSLQCAFSSISATAILLYSTTVTAADQVVLSVGAFRRSIPTHELTTFATTGKASPSLQKYLTVARQDPHQVRQVLNQPIAISPVLLNRGLNSLAGDALLDQLSQAVHTPSGQANRQALRATLVLSASQDGNITLLEAIQNYPTQEVFVEGARLKDIHQQTSALVNRIQSWLSLHQLF